MLARKVDPATVPIKLLTELPPRLQRLQGDVCGTINPSSGPFKYFLVLVDASGMHFEVLFLSTKNMVFPKIFTMLLKFQTHYLDCLVKTLRMDNAKEFISQQFEDNCVTSGISMSYSVPYEHSQCSLAKVFIKKIQLITRPLLIQTKLHFSFWIHIVLHVVTLLRFRPTLLNDHSPFELTS